MLVVFALTALLWIFRSLINDIQSVVKLDDTIIAILAAITLFIVPSEKKRTCFAGLARYIQNGMGHFAPFGGGIALADGLENTGLIQKRAIGWHRLATIPHCYFYWLLYSHCSLENS